MTDDGNTTSTLRRLRPYLAILVLAVVVVVVLLIINSGSGDDDSADDAQSDIVSGDGGSDSASDSDDPAGPAPDDSTPAGDGESDAAQPTGDGESDAAQPTGDGEDDAAQPTGDGEDDAAQPVDDEPSGPQYPGVGTEAALANPDCDPDTGRIRIPVPNAPPCVVEWPEGADNGGATAPGVTADAIYIAVRLDAVQASTGVEGSVAQQEWRDTIEIFDGHYELYGRRLEPVFIESSGGGEVEQRADAIEAINNNDLFFAVNVTLGVGGTAEVYLTEMAARGVIAWSWNAPWSSTQDLAPYRWAALQDSRTSTVHLVEYLSARVAGKPTQWAGDEAYNGTPRRIGVLHSDQWDKDYFQELADLKGGIEIVEMIEYAEEGGAAELQERATVMAARMKDAGITTAVAITGNTFTPTITRAATAQEWFPEWVLGGWQNVDSNFIANSIDQEQWVHAFGPSYSPPNIPAGRGGGEDRFVGEGGFLYEWHHGRLPISFIDHAVAIRHLVPMMQCLHLAGPNLTPETFAAGCFNAPPAGGTHCDCVMSPGVSFGERGFVDWIDYSANDDMTEKWWKLDPETGRGKYVAANGGKRYLPNEWAGSEANLFNEEGTIVEFLDWLPDEAPTLYEHEPRN